MRRILIKPEGDECELGYVMSRSLPSPKAETGCSAKPRILSGQRKRHRSVRPFPLGVERHRLAATAFEWGSTGLILGHPFQAEDEVGQD